MVVDVGVSVSECVSIKCYRFFSLCLFALAISFSSSAELVNNDLCIVFQIMVKSHCLMEV